MQKRREENYNAREPGGGRRGRKSLLRNEDSVTTNSLKDILFLLDHICYTILLTAATRLGVFDTGASPGSRDLRPDRPLESLLLLMLCGVGILGHDLRGLKTAADGYP